jgi:hypothetical protein
MHCLKAKSKYLNCHEDSDIIAEGPANVPDGAPAGNPASRNPQFVITVTPSSTAITVPLLSL